MINTINPTLDSKFSELGLLVDPVDFDLIDYDGRLVGQVALTTQYNEELEPHRCILDYRHFSTEGIAFQVENKVFVSKAHAILYLKTLIGLWIAGKEVEDEEEN